MTIRRQSDPKAEAVHLLGNLLSNPHLWSWAPGNDWQNNLQDTLWKWFSFTGVIPGDSVRSRTVVSFCLKEAVVVWTSDLEASPSDRPNTSNREESQNIWLCIVPGLENTSWSSKESRRDGCLNQPNIKGHAWQQSVRYQRFVTALPNTHGILSHQMKLHSGLKYHESHPPLVAYLNISRRVANFPKLQSAKRLCCAPLDPKVYFVCLVKLQRVEQAGMATIICKHSHKASWCDKLFMNYYCLIREQSWQQQFRVHRTWQIPYLCSDGDAVWWEDQQWTQLDQ